MGKYGALINQAKQPESQKVGETEKKRARKSAITKARKPEKTKARKAATLKAGGDNPAVNLGVKVPRSWRRHWAAEAKREGVSMTAIIVEALTKRFGKPKR